MTLPLGVGGTMGKYFSIEGRPAPSSLDQVPHVRHALISPDYFRTLGIAVRRGRSFNAQDRENSQPVVIINESAARRFFPNEDPIGKTIRLGPPDEVIPPDIRSLMQAILKRTTPPGAQMPVDFYARRLIVGVVADVKEGSLIHPVSSLVYAPLHQHKREYWSNELMLAVQTEGAPESLAGAIREQVRALDQDQPVASVRTMSQLLDRSLSDARFNLWLLGLFAVVALFLAAIGIYGVISYSVTQRTHEIGIRLALGAQPRSVLRLVVRQGMTLVVAGIAVGVAAAWALTRLMATMLFEVRATDPMTFALIALLLMGVALVACYIPARRAAKVDPMVALKYE
jgi:putative ABC transport system permease protein